MLITYLQEHAYGCHYEYVWNVAHYSTTVPEFLAHHSLDHVQLLISVGWVTHTTKTHNYYICPNSFVKNNNNIFI